MNPNRRVWLERILWISAVVLSQFFGLHIDLPRPAETKPGQQKPTPKKPDKRPEDESPKIPPKPKPVNPIPFPDAWRDAMITTLFGGNGCTGVVISGPVPGQNYQLAVTCNHCVPGVNAVGTAKSISTGRRYKVRVIATDANADCALLAFYYGDKLHARCRIDKRGGKVGLRVWHQGYGVHYPGRIEKGVLLEVDVGRWSSNYYRISASSGDSGSPIYSSETGLIVGLLARTESRPNRTAGPSARALIELVEWWWQNRGDGRRPSAVPG